MNNAKMIFRCFFFLFVLLYEALCFGDLLNTLESKPSLDQNKLEKEAPSPLKRDVEEMPKSSKKKPPSPVVEKISHRTQTEKKTSPSGNGKKDPVLFSGDHLFGDKAVGFLELKANVVVRRSDFLMKADKAKVFFNEKLDEVARVFAEGRVTIKKADKDPSKIVTTASDSAEYFSHEDLVVLKGHAEVHRGSDVVKGLTIKYNLKTGWVEAEKVSGSVESATENK